MPGKDKKNAPATAARRTRSAPEAEPVTAEAPARIVRRKTAAQPAEPSVARAPRKTARRASPRRQKTGSEPLAVVADRDTTATQAAVRGPEPAHHEIAERAYFIHLERRGGPGDPAADWARAERELRRERGLG